MAVLLITTRGHDYMQCGLNMFGNYLIWLKICIEPQLLPGRRFAQSIKILVLSLYCMPQTFYYSYTGYGYSAALNIGV